MTHRWVYDEEKSPVSYCADCKLRMDSPNIGPCTGSLDELNKTTFRYLHHIKVSSLPRVMHPGWTISEPFIYRENSMDDLQDTLISMAAAVILSKVKNPARKVELKKVMLKIFRTIQTVYAGDPDFQ